MPAGLIKCVFIKNLAYDGSCFGCLTCMSFVSNIGCWVPMFADCSCCVLLLDRSSLLWNLTDIVQDPIVNKMVNRSLTIDVF